MDSKYSEILKIENDMYKALLGGNKAQFQEIVDESALMVCGGYKETGKIYSGYVGSIKLKAYEIKEFEIKEIASDVILSNYIVNIDSFDPNFTGDYRVSSLWKKVNGKFTLHFNQDIKIK